jgi:lipopolysaccharide transport system ATP-binding protein
MSTSIIQAENLGKKYLLRHQSKERYIALRDVIARKAAAIGRRLLHRGDKIVPDPTREEFWALKDVSLEVKRGETIGIIGRNGAGKSTLLKVLSRITEPTVGKVLIKGRLASLLEVGTGFHPELTGRENIFLNGAILGMKKNEIKKKFDDIVSFAEVEKFVDTPVKRYSSGMYVRLAFAVAAYLEPDILMVDEVLSVGDAVFQKKCLGKMGDIAHQGRTVLFVSHNMGAISRLCNRVVLLESGSLKKDGTCSEVISIYLNSNNRAEQHFSQPADDNVPMCLLEASICCEDGYSYDSFPRHKAINVFVKYMVNQEISSAHVYSHILTTEGTVVLLTGDTDTKQSNLGLRKKGTYTCQYQIPANLLNEGTYKVNIAFGIPYEKSFQTNDNILSFRILDVEQMERYLHRGRSGVIWLNIPWKYSNSTPFED